MHLQMREKMKDKLTRIFHGVQDFVLVQAVRRALVTLIPVLMIGSFSVLFSSFPIEKYILFITTWQGGFLYELFDLIQGVTFGMFAVYMAGAIGYQIGALREEEDQDRKCVTMMLSLGSFFILSGSMNGMNTTFGARGMVVAIVAASVTSELYLFVAKKIRHQQLLADGADMNLWNAIHSIFPAVISLATVAFVNNILNNIFGTKSFYELTMKLITTYANHIGPGVAGGLTYVFLNSFLWFFGIHGSDVVEGISETLFKSSIQQNMESVLNGLQPTAIITRPFLNDFVMIGGCGATLCLLIALLLFSKRKGTKSLMKMSALPMIFNINEIMVFGLPIIYNPIFLIPFVLVPMVCFFTAYFATWMGWVPVVTKNIEWTTPILINGYLATDSLRGVILQIVNVAIGVAIYAPFVKLYDRKKADSAKKDYELMLEKLKECEASGKQIRLMNSSTTYGWMGKALAADLEYSFAREELTLFYQPQYNDSDKCIGVEALLRWKHPSLGWIYPPLILKLADEVGIREPLECWVLTKALDDAKSLREKCPETSIKVSVNVTGNSIQTKSFEEFLMELAKKNDVKALKICLEITEQDALLLDDNLRERFYRLREAGYVLAVDDFSMGSTSIRYLTGSHFELVKLDGSLVKGILDNPRCRDIIASIINLSDTLGVEVLAEYVEDENIRSKLLEVGCYLYQGWYYSPAVTLEEVETILSKNENSF